MLGFGSISEFAINEFGPFWIDLAPKTAQVMLIPLYRLELTVPTTLIGQVQLVPQGTPR